LDGSIILRHLAALSRLRITQTTPARDFDGGYQRIRRYGRTNGRTFDLPHSILGGRISGVIGLSQWCQPFSAAPFSLFLIFLSNASASPSGGARGVFVSLRQVAAF